MRKFDATGLLTHVNKLQPRYGEATSQSFTEAMYLVTEATENFMALPSEIRTQFNNDPAEYLDALSDPSQAERLTDMGLIMPNPENAPEGTMELAPSVPDGEPSASAAEPEPGAAQAAT